MGRLRKDKGQKATIKELSSSKINAVKSHSTKRSDGKKSGSISKEQVFALGGDEHDYDLVKEVKDGRNIADEAEADVNLS